MSAGRGRAAGGRDRPSPLRRVRDVIRWKEWADSKIPLFLVGAFAVLAERAAGGATVQGADLAAVLGLVAALCLLASFGNVANSLSDRSVDRAAGKPNALAEVPEGRARGLVLALGIGCVAVTALAAPRTPAVLGLLAASMATAAAYSLRPARLKERGLLGVAAATLAQRTLPAALVFAWLEGWGVAAALLCALGTLVGLRFILAHQVLDEAADRRSGVTTLVTARGAGPARRLLGRLVVPLEVGLLVATVGSMASVAPAAAWALALYAAWCGLRLQRGGSAAEGLSPTSFELLEGFYGIVWPVTLAATLAGAGGLGWALLLFVLVWQQRAIRRGLRRTVRRLGAVAGTSGGSSGGGPSGALRAVSATPAAARSALSRGTAALRALQAEDGSFPLDRRRGSGPWESEHPLFSTLCVLLAAGGRLPVEARARALAFVVDRRLDDGAWRFDPDSGIPPDSDDTACALTVLARFPADLPPDRRVTADDAAVLRRFWRDDGGPFATWSVGTSDDEAALIAGVPAAEWARRDRDDAAVNGHVLMGLRALAAATGSAPPSSTEQDTVAAFVRTSEDGCRYYCSPTTIALAARRGGLGLPELTERLIRRPRAREGALPSAQWLTVVARWDEGAVARVLAGQGPDGAWPAEPWFTGVGAPVPVWGGPAVSTALCLEGLAAALDAHEAPAGDEGHESHGRGG